MMMILAVVRRLPELLELQRERTWQPLPARELRQVTVGIVGLGSIGRAVARLAVAFGARVIATRRDPDRPDRSAQAGHGDDLVPDGLARILPHDQLPDLLAESDFVVLALPLTTETEKLMDAARLAAMKPDAWLINVARGRLVDQAALLRALRAAPSAAPSSTRSGRSRCRRARRCGTRRAHHHPAHLVVERPCPRSQHRALLREPRALPRRPTAAQCRRPAGWLLVQVAIVGLARSGKTTVFNSLTRGHGRPGASVV